MYNKIVRLYTDWIKKMILFRGKTRKKLRIKRIES